MNITTRPEEYSDFDQIRLLNILAFDRADEADLIDRIRNENEYLPALSFVALHNSKIIGHIMLSKITIGEHFEGLAALAPMAVLPDFQNKGIGSLLVDHAVSEAEKIGLSAIVVLGHPNFYPRFGFGKASLKGITCPYAGVPNEAFLVKELYDNSLKGISGMVTYSTAFTSEQ
ncbi:GNAT family N-acetyltransferase [Flavobacterium sp. MK4S-17]|uniref:GNAT family N-acetyltransferase n=1 Tax=Flavobacterium sp. MK4S-17 TaxID=2543737 RepID=UPI001358F847|nr:N-acetyltransferase [Flavobacterium sp. MK4S-17]